MTITLARPSTDAPACAALGMAGRFWCRRRPPLVLADRLPDGATLRDLGVHRLRTSDDPEHVWQLVASGSSGGVPAAAIARRLPSQPSGSAHPAGRSRRARSPSSRALIAEERLVTLVGSAGVGKTRLALAVSADLLDRYRGGVWWVELAALC